MKFVWSGVSAVAVLMIRKVLFWWFLIPLLVIAIYVGIGWQRWIVTSRLSWVASVWVDL